MILVNELYGTGHPLAAGIFAGTLEFDARMPGFAESQMSGFN